MMKQNIKEITGDELQKILSKEGFEAYRIRQVIEWLWKKNAHSFAEMSSLSKALRDKLEELFTLPVLKTAITLESKDKTLKLGFSLPKGEIIEGVLIPAKDRVTACISTQVGCNVGCTFCATATMGYKRNLTFYEIYDQVALLNKLSEEKYKKKLSNIVIMGMGEPLLNYEAVMQALRMVTDPDLLAFSPQRITLSSVGIPKMIQKLAEEKLRIQLAISLHSANDGKRDKIVPLNKKYPLQEISKALVKYHEKTNARIIIEYLLLKGFNDSKADAQELAVFCKSFPVKVNLIAFNAVPGCGYSRSEDVTMNAFKDVLEKKNMIVQMRRSRGTDIAAACGQLAARKISATATKTPESKPARKPVRKSR
ncbi:MAG: 23S rRNA (adenine(2503)-C(2))-methyltransferase RlmN [Bacteroidota bacterium]